jgi:hypothetical protein
MRFGNSRTLRLTFFPSETPSLQAIVYCIHHPLAVSSSGSEFVLHSSLSQQPFHSNDIRRSHCPVAVAFMRTRHCLANDLGIE